MEIRGLERIYQSRLVQKHGPNCLIIISPEIHSIFQEKKRKKKLGIKKTEKKTKFRREIIRDLNTKNHGNHIVAVIFSSYDFYSSQN